MENLSNSELTLLYKEFFIIESPFYELESEISNYFNFQGELLSPNHLNLVENILKVIPGKKFSLLNSFSINLNKKSLTEINQLVQESSSQYFFIWGDNEFSDSNKLEKYKAQQIEDKWFILTDSTFELIKSKEKKEKLWLAIKSVFK